MVYIKLHNVQGGQGRASTQQDAQSCPGSTMTHAARSKQFASADEATCSLAGSRLCSLLSKHMGMWHATIKTNSWATPMHPLVNKCMVHTLHLIACCLTATWLPLMLQLVNTSSQPNLKILRQTCHVCPTSQIMHCTYPCTLRSGTLAGWLAPLQLLQPSVGSAAFLGLNQQTITPATATAVPTQSFKSGLSPSTPSPSNSS